MFVEYEILDKNENPSRINKNDVYVSKEPIYRNKLISVIIYGKNHKEISKIKGKLEKLNAREFKLKSILKGK